MANPIISEIKNIRAETKRLATGEVLSLRLLNNTGANLVSGDVVVLDTAAASAVKFAGAAGAANPMVVYQGGVAGEYVKALNSGVIMQITCDGAAIAIGDRIVASATARYGCKVVTPATDNVLGIALQTKADAVVGTVRTLLVPGGGVPGGGGGYTLTEGETGHVTLLGTEYTIDSRVAVDTDAPASPWTGMLWYDTDA